MKRNAIILLFFALISFKSVSTNHLSYSYNLRDKNDPTLLDSILNYGLNFMGTPYHYGSKGPRSFDCSGFTSFIFRHFGYDLGRDSRQQAKQALSIRKSDLKKGDLVFFEGRRQNGVVGHVGIVIEKKENGEFNFLHASTNQGVTISSSDQAYYTARFLKGGRVVGADNYTPTERDLLSTAAVLEELSRDDVENSLVQKNTSKYHTVVKGENLSEISKKYDVPVSTLKELNNLKSNKIKKGTRLIISNIQENIAENQSASEKSIIPLAENSANNIKIANPTTTNNNPETLSYASHKVQKGETLFSIAKENNISVQRLKELNNLGVDKLTLGQDLILPKPQIITGNSSEPTYNSATNIEDKQPREQATKELAEKYIEKVVYNPAIKHKVKKGETISEIADDNNISVKELKKLNNLSSEKIKPGQVLLVKEAKKTIKKEKVKSTPLTSDNKILAESANINVHDTSNNTPSRVADKTLLRSEKVTYKVQKGETLYDIARKNNVTVKDIKQMNNLSSDKLTYGQVLLIKENEEISSDKVTTQTISSEPIKQQLTESSKSKSTKENVATTAKTSKHTILKGETLYDIARENDMTVDELKELNNISSDNLKLGQVLNIKKGEKNSTVEQKKSDKKEKSGITTHVVKNGESLYSIRKKYGCKLDQLKKWNNLSGESLKIGQKLIIYQ